MKSPRPFYLLLLLACAGLLAFGYYLQFAVGLDPCPLCIFQRLAFIAIAILALLGLVHGPQALGLRLYSALISTAALTGAGIAGWQVRLQHLPADQIPECGPGLGYMLQSFPLSETLKLAFTGSGECAEVQWSFLGLSIPEWSLICFVAITITAIVHALRKRLIGVF